MIYLPSYPFRYQLRTASVPSSPVSPVYSPEQSGAQVLAAVISTCPFYG